MPLLEELGENLRVSLGWKMVLAPSVFYVGDQCQIGGHGGQTLISALGKMGGKGKKKVGKREGLG